MLTAQSGVPFVHLLTSVNVKLVSVADLEDDECNYVIASRGNYIVAEVWLVLGEALLPKQSCLNLRFHELHVALWFPCRYLNTLQLAITVSLQISQHLAASYHCFPCRYLNTLQLAIIVSPADI